MTAPLSDAQLATMARRLTEITPGNWLVASDEHGRPLIYVERGGESGRAMALPLLTADAATEADVQFVTHARDYVPTLLAEVDRLHAELATARAAALGEAETALANMLEGMQEGNLRYRGLTFAIGLVQGVRLYDGPAAPAERAEASQ